VLFFYVLGLAVFAQGMSEFMLSGLVPDIARDLSVSVGASASLTSAYAVGMVVGAPVMAALSARWPRRRALVVFLVVFVAVHVLGALTDDFVVLFGTRVVAAVANAGFLAVAMSVVGARGTAVLIGGITLACVAGVPGGAVLGQLFGWRSAFWAVAALCLPALVLVLRSAPAEAAGPRDADLGAEVRVLRSRPLLRTLVLAVLVNGATFATFAYLAVVATDVAGLSPSLVPAVLAAFGAGACAGVTTASRLVGVRLKVVLAVLPAGWVVLALVGEHVVALFLVTAIVGVLSFGAGSALVARVMNLADGAPTLGGAYATVALNVGAVIGPLLGAFAGTGVAWVSAVLAACATAFALPRPRVRQDGS
jgi:DHA1 family chloramphenicol resistance protein-like MFS transporter